MVVIWSGRGRRYARDFADANGLSGATAFLAKPDFYVDDIPEIRNRSRMQHVSPEVFIARGVGE